MKILIVSDTHRRDGNLTQVLDMVGQIDLLIHCGDVEGSEAFIKSIAGCPVHMVAGNNDPWTSLLCVGWDRSDSGRSGESGRRYRDVWTYAPSVDFYRSADERDGNQPGQHFLPAAGGQTTVLCPDGAGSGGQCPLSSGLFVRGRGYSAIRNTIECTLREHSIVMNRVFAHLPASAEHPAQHSRAAADHQRCKKVISDILKAVIDYQSQSCQHTKIQTPGQKSP